MANGFCRVDHGICQRDDRQNCRRYRSLMQIDFMSDPHYPERHDDMDVGVCNHTGGLFQDLIQSPVRGSPLG